MQENKKEKKDTPIMLIASVALIVMMIMGGYYWYIYAPQQLNNPTKTDEQKELELQLLREKINNDTVAKMFFEAIDKRKNFSLDYYGSYQETFADMKTQSVVIQRIGEKKYVNMQNYIYGQEIYYDENEMQFCQTEYADSQICAQVESEQKKEIEKGLDEIFLNYKDTERETNEKMYKHGILNFETTTTQTQIASRKCNMIEYQLDYSNLSDETLLELGLNRTDPVVSVFKDFVVKECFDSETGVSLLTQLKYRTVFGEEQMQEYKLEYDIFETQTDQEFDIPDSNATLEQIEQIGLQMEELKTRIDKCIDEEQKTMEDCLSLDAINNEQIRTCSFIEDKEKRESCAMKLVFVLNRADLCEKTGEQKDDCYLNYAYMNKDISYCTVIVDAQKREQCKNAMESLNQTTEPIGYMNDENEGSTAQIDTQIKEEYSDYQASEKTNANEVNATQNYEEITTEQEIENELINQNEVLTQNSTQ